MDESARQDGLFELIWDARHNRTRRTEFVTIYGGCEGKAYILGHAPVPYPWDMAKDLSDLFAYLKQVMAHPEKGTWLDVEYTITFPDRYSVEYSYGKDDAFEPLPDPSDLRRELQLYPRASKYIPEWFRKAVEEG